MTGFNRLPKSSVDRWTACTQLALLPGVPGSYDRPATDANARPSPGASPAWIYNRPCRPPGIFRGCLDMADFYATLRALNIQHVARRSSLERRSFGKVLPTTCTFTGFMKDLACHRKAHFPAYPFGAWLLAALALIFTWLVCRRCLLLIVGCPRRLFCCFRLWRLLLCGICCRIVYGIVSLTLFVGIGSLFPRRITLRRTRAVLGRLIQPITRIPQIIQQLAAQVQQMPRRQRCQVFLVDLLQVVICQLHGCHRTKVVSNLQTQK